MKPLFILLFSFIALPFVAKAQAGDFVVIKKNGQTIRNFLKGGYVRFITTANERIEGRIIDIHSDSIFFKEIIVQRVPTPWGVTNLDTVATSLRGIKYTDIAAIPRAKEGFSYVKNGSIFMIGGAGYVVLNLVNGAYLNYPPFGKKNLPGMAAAAGVFAGGLIMNKLHKPYHKIQKKYSIEYIKLSSTTP